MIDNCHDRAVSFIHDPSGARSTAAIVMSYGSTEQAHRRGNLMRIVQHRAQPVCPQKLIADTVRMHAHL